MSDIQRLKFKRQEIVYQHRINDISEEYEMLAKIDTELELEVEVLNSWANNIMNQDIPFVITKAEESKKRGSAKKTFYHFYVNGPQKKPITSESKKFTGKVVQNIF